MFWPTPYRSKQQGEDLAMGATRSRGARLNALKVTERVLGQAVSELPKTQALIDAGTAWLDDADARRAMREHKRQCRACRYADRPEATRVHRCTVGQALNRRRARAAWRVRQT
jgi:hypothetical protein